MRLKGFHGLFLMFSLLAALLIVSPAKMAALQNTQDDLYIYGQSVVPDTISGPTNVTFSASLMNERVYALSLEHFWISLINKSGVVQSFNTTYEKVDLPSNTSKTEMMTVLIENLDIGDYNVTLRFGYTTVFNATETDVLPDFNVTLAVVEPESPQPRLLLYFFIGSVGFIAALFIIGGVGTYLERKRRKSG